MIVRHSFHKNNRRSAQSLQKGLTMIELIIYMAMFSLLMVSLTGIFSAFIDAHLEAQATSSVEQDGRYLLSRLTYDITKADTVTSPVSLGQTTSILQLITDGVTHTYSLNGSGNLILANSFGSNQLNGFDSTISNLTFQRIGNVGGAPTIKIHFTISSITKRASGSEVREYNTTIGLRQ